MTLSNLAFQENPLLIRKISILQLEVDNQLLLLKSGKVEKTKILIELISLRCKMSNNNNLLKKIKIKVIFKKSVRMCKKKKKFHNKMITKLAKKNTNN